MHFIYRGKATNEMGRRPLMVRGNKFKGGRVLWLSTPTIKPESQTKRGSKQRPESHLSQWCGKNLSGRRHTQKATRHYYVPADVHKMLGKDALTLKSQVINIH